MRPPARCRHRQIGRSAVAAAVSRMTRSSGTKGVSPAAVITNRAFGRCARVHSRAASTPARGPGKPATESGTTGRANSAKRLASPLALRIRASTWGASRSITCDRIGRPATRASALSPPPMRRAKPPARIAPTTSVAIVGTFAVVAAVLRGDLRQIRIEHDPRRSRERHEPLAARAVRSASARPCAPAPRPRR